MGSFKDSSEILFEHKNRIGFVKFNRAKALNALTPAMVQNLHELLDYCANANDISALFFEGEGRAFCSGGDVLAAYHAKQHGSNYIDFFRSEYLYNIKLHKFSKPVISFYDGIVMGGGVGNSIYGKYKIATENTLWAMPEAAIGFFTDVGASYFTQPLSLALALFVCLTGVRLSGADCVKLGFASHYILNEHLENLKNELLNNINEDVEIIDAILAKYNISELKPSFVESKLNLIEDCFDASSVEEIIDNLQSNATPEALDVLNMFKTLSPLSLKIIFKHIVSTRGLSLEQCMKQDYVVMYHMLHGLDFYEGVRALLVDKDKNPQWQYKNISEISEDRVEAYFQPLDHELY